MGMCFWQVSDGMSSDDPAKRTQSVADVTGAVYFMTVVQMYLNFQPTVIVFQGEKPIYTRERDSGMYDIWTYATTKLIAEIPIMLFVPFLFLVFGHDDSSAWKAIGIPNQNNAFTKNSRSREKPRMVLNAFFEHVEFSENRFRSS